MRFNKFLVSLLLTCAVAASAFAQRRHHYEIIYSDSGYAWRYEQNDLYAQRRTEIELHYQDQIRNADNRYNDAIAAREDPDAAQRVREDDYAQAEDDRVAAYDALYTRWNECFTLYPTLFITGYGGPCRYLAFDVLDGAISELWFLAPYPGCSVRIFDWNWGEHHRFKDFDTCRGQYHKSVEAILNRRIKSNEALRLEALHNVHQRYHQQSREPVGHVGERRNGGRQAASVGTSRRDNGGSRGDRHTGGQRSTSGTTTSSSTTSRSRDTTRDRTSSKTGNGTQDRHSSDRSSDRRSGDSGRSRSGTGDTHTDRRSSSGRSGDSGRSRSGDNKSSGSGKSSHDDKKDDKKGH